MTFEEYFEKRFPEHFHVLKDYDADNSCVHYGDTLLPRKVWQITEDAWNAGAASTKGYYGEHT
jgi:hypothetical protein